MLLVLASSKLNSLIYWIKVGNPKVSCLLFFAKASSLLSNHLPLLSNSMCLLSNHGGVLSNLGGKQESTNFLLNVVKKLLLLSFCCTFACEFGIMCTYVNKEKTQE